MFIASFYNMWYFYETVVNFHDWFGSERNILLESNSDYDSVGAHSLSCWNKFPVAGMI